MRWHTNYKASKSTQIHFKTNKSCCLIKRIYKRSLAVQMVTGSRGSANGGTEITERVCACCRNRTDIQRPAEIFPDGRKMAVLFSTALSLKAEQHFRACINCLHVLPMPEFLISLWNVPVNKWLIWNVSAYHDWLYCHPFINMQMNMKREKTEEKRKKNPTLAVYPKSPYRSNKYILLQFFTRLWKCCNLYCMTCWKTSFCRVCRSYCWFFWNTSFPLALNLHQYCFFSVKTERKSQD